MSAPSTAQREIDRIREALLDPAHSSKHAELHAAQQALCWVLDHEGARSPFDTLMVPRLDEPEHSIAPVAKAA